MEYKLLKSQQGQATTEYLLVLIVTVGIIVGTLTQFSNSFREFADSYFGDYVSCLLETGEIPSLGVDDEQTSELAQICNEEYQPFTFANGRPPIREANQNNNSNPQGRRNSRPGTLAESSEGGGNTFRARRSGGGRVAGGGSLGAGGSFSGTRRQQREPSDSEEGELAGSSGRGFSQSYGADNLAGAVDRDRITQFKVAGRGKKSKSDEDEEQAVTTRAKKDSDAATGRVVSFDEKKREPTAEVSDLDEGLDFSDYLRYLIMIAIIIVLVVFLGGQALQISKSME